MSDYVTLPLSSSEYEMLIRLVGHHTSGAAWSRVYERLVALRPNHAIRSENIGPLPCVENHPYGNRPMVKV